jgi:hypothetical protein
VIGPLTDPTPHGGSPEDVFEVTIPFVPGYGVSGKPTGIGWDPVHIARAWAELVQRPGYTSLRRPGVATGTPLSSAIARPIRCRFG